MSAGDHSCAVIALPPNLSSKRRTLVLRSWTYVTGVQKTLSTPRRCHRINFLQCASKPSISCILGKLHNDQRMLDIAPVGSERSVEGMEYTVAGHTIRFPHAAYGVQLSFMGKALQTLAGRSNALLEAPTGSGKTLSLLCSSLAWQEAVKLQRQAVPQCGYGLSFVV